MFFKTFSMAYQGYIVPASTLIPIIAGLINYKKLSKATHALILYLCIAFLINVAGSAMAAYRQNNMPLLHFYTLFELVAVMWYYKLAFNSKAADKWINLIMIIYPVVCVVNFIFFQSLYEFNTYTRPLEAIVISVTSCIYLSTHSTTYKREAVSNHERWISSGFLLYFCSSLFQFVFSNVVSHSVAKPVKMIIWDLHATFVLIMYIFFFVAIKHETNNR